MFFQVLIDQPAVDWIGAFKTDTAEQKTLSAPADQRGDSAPKQSDDASVPGVRRHAGAADFDCQRSDRCKTVDPIFLFRIKAQFGACGDGSEMNAVCSNDTVVVFPHDDKMQAMFVKLVLVDSVLRVFQPFALFQIEYVIAQTERGFDFLLR